MIWGIWDRETVAFLVLVAMLPLAVAWIWYEGASAATRLLFFFLAAAIWNLVWMLARAQPPSVACVTTALAVAILVPDDLGPVPLLLGISFGVIFGELVFGGWGRNILNPATVALAFVGFGFPAAPWPEIPLQLGWAAALSVFLMVGLGVASARPVLGFAVACAIAVRFHPEVLAIGPAVAVVLVLLVLDPVASASTPPGGWINGALFAGFAALFHVTWGEASGVQIAVSAALLVSLITPLVDELAVMIWLHRRRRRHG